MNRESAFKSVMWQFVIAFAIALIIVVREEIAGGVSPRGMAIIVMGLAIVGWVFLTVSFTRINRQYRSEETPQPEFGDQASRRKILRRVRRLQAFVVIMPLLLVFGLATTIGEPILPRVTGAAANLGFMWVLVRALRAGKAELQRMNDNSAPDPTNQQITIKADKA